MPDRRILPLLFWLLAGLACQVPEGVPDRGSAPPSPTAASSRPVRDLAHDEEMGGHTLRQHVGRTDEQLRERLSREPITAASTWTDRQTAERAVGLALEENRERIERWLARRGSHPNLVIDYDGDLSHPIGRSLRRGTVQPEPCSQAVVVLKWAGGSDYYVLTSYPECR